ncbi:ABC transporter ATP-binding protein [Clostridium sp. ATCC 25772]|uniref:ABC transporter ATP-binding protein n=1 Tax=Clostridium sp. ATCC 25772 TaxID=1676991 RepID=UPI000782F542|nr:ABC transporter ATP-binding protein [Clostridium sp. ATCC 25772]
MKNKYIKIYNVYRRYVKNHSKIILLMVSILTILTIATMYQPIIMAKLIDNIIGSKWQRVKVILIKFIIIYAIISILTNATEYVKKILVNKVTLNLRKDISSSILDLEVKEFESISKGEFITIMNNDIESISTFLIEKSVVILDLIEFIILGLVLFLLNYKLAIIILLNFPISLVVFKIFGEKLAYYDKEYKEIQDEYNNFNQECISGFNIINILQAQNTIKYKFNCIINKQYINSKKINKVNVKSNLLGELINGILYTILILVACYEIYNGRLTIGIFIAFNSYASTFSNSLFNITSINKDLQQITVSINRIEKIISDKANKSKCLDDEYPIFKHEILFKNVSFAYSREMPKILNNISFRLKNRCINGIIGENGIGKTTILKLLMKLYSDYEGEILFDNIELNKISKSKLYKKITYIPQDTFLFTATIKENLTLGNLKCDEKSIIHVCESVNIHNFIDELDKGYDTLIGTKGIQLSGGQKQKLTVARGLLRKSEVFLFDEITSSADSNSEENIIEVMKTLIKMNKTVIIVSHKEKILENCDNIIRLNNCLLKSKGVV